MQVTALIGYSYWKFYLKLISKLGPINQLGKCILTFEKKY